MEQQMQDQIEDGMSEAALAMVWYDLVSELKAECLRLESCLASKTEIANQLKDGLADAFERETNLKAERNALACQVIDLKEQNKILADYANALSQPKLSNTSVTNLKGGAA